MICCCILFNGTFYRMLKNGCEQGLKLAIHIQISAGSDDHLMFMVASRLLPSGEFWGNKDRVDGFQLGDKPIIRGVRKQLSTLFPFNTHLAKGACVWEDQEIVVDRTSIQPSAIQRVWPA